MEYNYIYFELSTTKLYNSEVFVLYMSIPNLQYFYFYFTTSLIQILYFYGLHLFDRFSYYSYFVDFDYN